LITFLLFFIKMTSSICPNLIKTFFMVGTKHFKTCITLGLLMIISVRAFANIYTVTSTSDFPITGGVNNANGVITGGAGNGFVTLRSAIAAANNVAGPHTINLGANTYNLTIAGPGEGTGGDITIGDIDVLRSDITIQGAGMNSTIINQTTGVERVFDVNVNYVSGSVFNFTIDGVTVSGGRSNAANGFTEGGGIFCGNNVANGTTTVTNCKFLNNQSAGAGLGGGAISNDGGNLIVTGCIFGGTNPTDFNQAGTSGGGIYWQARGLPQTFTCTNSTFTNNVALSASAGGGGIDVAAINLGSGTINISGCTFTGNHANNSGGGAITNESVSMTVTKCTFLNNTANFGGAVKVGGGLGTTANFCRLVGNTATSSGNGFNVAGAAVTMNGDNNWWGVNTGPGANGATASGGATLTLTRWLQLKNTASSSPICNAGTSTITASFLSNNLGEAISTANLTTVIGQPITFNAPANGTLSAAQTSVQANGTATVTFTSTTAGAGSANAVFVPATENFTVTTSPTITINQPSVAPTSITGTTTICTPSSTTLTATGGTLGTGANYQWGIGAVVGTTPIPGQTASTLNVSPGSATTYWVRIENTAAPCTGTTGGVTQVVTVNNPSVAPSSITGTTTICIGGSTTLTANGGTLGTGANYQWGTGAVVGTSPLAGQTASSLTVSPGSTTTFWVRIENTSAPCTGNTGGVTKVVTVQPDNTITFSSGAVNQTKSAGQAITTTNWNTTGATGATFSGLPPNVTGNWAANVATISGTVTTPATYNYTVTLTGGCNGGSTGGQIIVTPALAVHLISFTGKLNSDKTVTLQWKVEEQQDIQQYIVEESSDGSVFNQSGVVVAGNSSSQTYSFIDRQVSTGNNYYRLKIVELSGKISYSNIVLVNLKAGITVMLYPNPVTGQLTIQQFGTIQNKSAVLFDGQGKILQQINLTNLEQQVNMEKYSAGVYILKLEDGTVFKVVKQ
jgi:Secretion system C-terminal sorting domain